MAAVKFWEPLRYLEDLKKKKMMMDMTYFKSDIYFLLRAKKKKICIYWSDKTKIGGKTYLQWNKSRVDQHEGHADGDQILRSFWWRHCPNFFHGFGVFGQGVVHGYSVRMDGATTERENKEEELMSA